MRLKQYIANEMINEIAISSWISKVKTEVSKLSIKEIERKCREAFYQLADALLKRLDDTKNDSITVKIADEISKLFIWQAQQRKKEWILMN